jgi:hypothetical protein
MMALAARAALVLGFLSAAVMQSEAFMKVNIELDMTPDEARRLMGLPDVAAMQERMAAEIEKRMKAALNTSDPQAMLKAWFPMGGEPLEQFQRFWDRAKAGAAKNAKR